MFIFEIAPDDGETYEVEAITRDILKWERTTKGASASQLSEPSMATLYKLAWIASQRTGQFAGTLKDFEDSVDLGTRTAEEPDPTQSGATADR